MSIVCPHCSATNESTAQFCTSCGKALPTQTTTGPRVVSDKEFASSKTGQTLQLAEMKKQVKTAFSILLTIAILQAIGGGLLLILGLLAPGSAQQAGAPTGAFELVFVGVFVLILCAIFTTLAFWARKSPLPAAITGLALYATLVIAGIVVSGGQVRGLVIPIIICIALSRAIAAGVKHRALKQHMAV
ncbi:MAG: zinc-ribbon domain-containing protein [Phycisphaeraceae bacterium]|nr:zinc-ribbon domain-containing protein [Phycisphaeraceae bacterium]MCW5769845.1 zinc-ribbon domain-containing protein [Phycisphaeraceae bacterium]